jgi:intracellular multiplication protein IcmP
MAAAQQGGQGGDNTYSILWSIAAIFLVGGVIWVYFKKYIAITFLTIKLYELSILRLVSGHYFDDLHASILYLLTSPDTIQFTDLLTVGRSVGDWLRFPFMILLIILACVVYITNATRSFKHTYGMRDFAKFEQVNWPQISPVVNLDLVKTDIDTGSWAMAMTPMQFCKRHQLLDEVKPQRVEGMSRKDWDKINVVLRKGEANRLFALQLGQLWKGPETLTPYAKALFAVFAARINADSKAAAKLLAQLSASSTTKLNFNGVNSLLNNHFNTKLVQRVVTSHAYALTVMAAMLATAREDGVQASADFLWLKPIDRKLWYTLNTVGRQTPFVEVAGIYAHWVAEKEAGRKLLVPMVEEATKALEIALKEVVYRPDETGS